MRQVYEGNVSSPLHVVTAFLAANESNDMPAMVEASKQLVAALKEGNRRIQAGLDDSNLSVCIGKLAYVNAVDAKRFLSGEIPRITLQRNGKGPQSMPLYFKHKPSEYLRRAAQKAKQKGRKHGKASSKTTKGR